MCARARACVCVMLCNVQCLLLNVSKDADRQAQNVEVKVRKMVTELKNCQCYFAKQKHKVCLFVVSNWIRL